MLEKITIGRQLPNSGDRGANGATATEYGLLVAFIAIAILVAITAFGGALATFFTQLTTTVAGWVTP